MSHESTPAAAPFSPSLPQRSPGLRSPRSAWLVIGVAAGLLWVAALQGSLGVIVWLLATGSLLVLTALYALGFRRRSWAGLDTLEQRKFALSLGAVVLVVGMVAGVVSTPDPVPGSVSEDAAGLEPRPDLFASPTTPPPGSVLRQALPPNVEEAVEEAEPDTFALLGDTSSEEPTEEASIADAACGTPGQSRVQRQIEYRCTHNPAGDLVWMESGAADRLAEERAAAVQQAETARRAEEERARQADAQREQELAQRRAAEERARDAAPVPQPPNPANPPNPVNPPVNQPQPPPIEPPGEPPVEPPPEPGRPPGEPPTEPPPPPSEPPTPPPSPDPTAPPPTPPGPPDPPDPGTPDPDIPILPPEFPFPPDRSVPPRTSPPASSFAPPSVVPDETDATEAPVEAGLPAAR